MKCLCECECESNPVPQLLNYSVVHYQLITLSKTKGEMVRDEDTKERKR